MASQPFQPRRCTAKELAAKIDRFLDLKPLFKEYEKLDAFLKDELWGVKKATIGHYEYTGTEKHGPGGIQEPYTYWERSFTRKADKK